MSRDMSDQMHPDIVEDHGNSLRHKDPLSTHTMYPSNSITFIILRLQEDQQDVVDGILK